MNTYDPGTSATLAPPTFGQPAADEMNAWGSQAPAARFRKPGWRDPRLVFGLILLALGIALGSAAVSVAGDTVSVYQAKTTIPTGQELSKTDVNVSHVRINDHKSHYLTPDVDQSWWDEQPVVQRTVAQGELIPLSAVASEEIRSFRPVNFDLPSTQDGAFKAGDFIDVWHVPDVRDDGEPQKIASEVEVSALTEDSSTLSLSGAHVATVLIPSSEVPTVLTARNGDGEVELVKLPAGEISQ